MQRQNLAESSSMFGFQSASNAGSNNNQAGISGLASPAKRSFIFSLFSRSQSKESELKNYVSGEGSVSQQAWLEMSKESPLKVRLKAVEQLQTLARTRRLQFSTVEAIFSETRDLLECDETKAAVMQLLITVTTYQNEQVGIVLRDAFFREISKSGLNELTLTWLDALTVAGEKIDGFDCDILLLVKDWAFEVLDPNVDDHPLAIRVLQFIQRLVRANAAFLKESLLDEVVRTVCVRICCRSDHLTHECMVLLDVIFKYGHIPDNELSVLVTTLCTIISVNEFGMSAWNLMRDLLRSHCGHTVLSYLLGILDKAKEYRNQKVVVGAIDIIAMSLWGTQRVESLRCHPSAVLPVLAASMDAGPVVVREVFISIKRLIRKYGKDLQQLSWHCLLQLLSRAVVLCKKLPPEERRAELTQQLHLLIDMIEQLYRDGEYAGSPETMFSLIESCSSDRPPSSLIALLDHRAACIDPLCANWLDMMYQFVDRYLQPEGNPSIVREKAIGVLHNVYCKYHLLYEWDIVMNLVLPILATAVEETDTKIQYQMLNVLFDVIKTVSMRSDSERDLFSKTVNLIRPYLSSEFQKSSSNDNLEIVAGGICEVLDERFAQLKLPHLEQILNIFCGHLRSHYRYPFTDEIGSEIRERLFSALLSITSDSATGQLVKLGETAIINTHIIRAGIDTDGEFTWAEICDVVCLALERELWFPVLRVILLKLSRVLECQQFVATAGRDRIENLKDALLKLHYKRNDLLSENDLDVKRDEISSLSPSPRRSDVDLATYICPVLSRLVNYSKDENICKVIVESVSSTPGGCQQSIMACDLAVQILPEGMAPLARQLMTQLASLHPSAVLAIPVIELLSDSSDVEEFYQFFQTKHFKCVVDVLVPYTNVHRFNTFIVASSYRTLMRWFVKMPESLRPEMSAYILEKINAQLLIRSRSSSSIGAQLDGDQQTVGIFSGTLPDTPPPFLPLLPNRVVSEASKGRDVTDASRRENLAREARDALTVFMRHGQIGEANETSNELPSYSPSVIEQKVEHWVINDTVISISMDVETAPRRIGTAESSNVDPLSGEMSQSFSMIDNDRTVETRRRHQSAVQRANRCPGAPPPAALDDFYALPKAAIPRSHLIAAVVWTRIIIRHMYGKRTWMMRALSETPACFDAAVIKDIPRDFFADADSLILHLCSDHRAVKIVENENKLSRSLRNIDRISALELHTVGVVYIAYGQTTESDILANVYGSERYSRFIRMLGDPVSLNESPGGLCSPTHGKFTYVLTDATTRYIFHIATLMPTKGNDPHCNEKKKFIGNDYVSIIFNESGKPYKLGMISGRFAYVAIEVVPQSESHVLVTVHARREISSWLAISRAFLPDHHAAQLLPRLILRAQLSVNVWRREEEEKGVPYISLAVERLRAIRTLAQSGVKQV